MSLLNEILRYEQEGVNRQAILSLVADQLKEIDSKRKEIKESIEAEIKPLGAKDSCKAVNAICFSGSCGSDNAGKSRLSRRRTWLMSILTKVHTDYDFVKIDGHITCTYVGDAIVREAKVIHKTLDRLVTLDLLSELPTIEDVVTALKTEIATDAPVTETLHIDSSTVDSLRAIAEKASRVADSLGTVPQEVEHQEQAQA